MRFDNLISLCKPTDVWGDEPESLGALVHDSRKVTEGSVFIAVPGTQTDGHAYIEEAVKAGAAVVICEKPITLEEKGVAFVRVESTKSLLGFLAQAFEGNPARKLKLIGITGTNGKTTVATLVYQALRAMDVPASLLSTAGKRINDQKIASRLTTADPIELARDMKTMVDTGSSHLVMEVSSHALDQQRTNGLMFEVAAFTNLSHDHIDYHGTTADYAEAKKRLFDGLSPSSIAIINADDSHGRYMTLDCRGTVIRFGFEIADDVKCKVVEYSADGLKLQINGTEISSNLLGSFNAYNLAQAFLICRALDFSETAVTVALQTVPGPEGRMERVKSNSDVREPLVLVDYAHTPDALEKAGASLKGLKSEDQKLWILFGCGGNRDRGKRPKMAAAAEKNADYIVVTSDNPRDEDPESIIDDIMAGFSAPVSVERKADRREAIFHAIRKADSSDIILIAGKGHETYQEIAGKRIDFDDRTIALEALRQRNGNPKPEEVT